MRQPRFTSIARRDLKKLLKYIASRDPVAAIGVLERIEASCRRLALDPGVGQARPDLGPDLRFFPVGNYLIFYRERKEGIQVIRVIHGSRNYRATDV